MQPATGHSRLTDPILDEERLSPVLARNVKALRLRAKINKKRFALMIGVGRPFLNKIENGLADPRLSVITKIANALDTTPEYLLTEHEDAPAPQPSAGMRRPGQHARL